jgi:predicted P-loop ATPase
MKISTIWSLEDKTPQQLCLTTEQRVEFFLEHEEVALKKQAKLWSPHTFYDGTRHKNAAEFCSALVYDLDDPKYAIDLEIERVCEQLVRDDTTFFVHETYTEGKYRVIVPLCTPCPAWAHGRLYDSYAKYLKLDSDPKAKGEYRFYFTPSCPPGASRRTANHEGQCLSPTWVAAPIRIDMEALKARIQTVTSDPEKRAHLKMLFNAQISFKQGSRDISLHTMMWILSRLSERPIEWSNFSDLVSAALKTMDGVAVEGHAYWLGKAKYSYERGLEARAVDDARREAMNKFLGTKPVDGEAFSPEESWREKLLKERNRKGEMQLVSHTANIEVILDHDEAFKGHLRFNLLRRKLEIAGGPLKNSPEETLDMALSNYLVYPPWGLNVSRDSAGGSLLHCALKNGYDPVETYLRSLKWDGTPRIENVLTKMCGAEGFVPYLELVSKKFFIAAAARALRPGCQVDTVLVLQGAQGVGKTSFVRAIGKGWHVEIKLDLGNKDATMITTANWLVELSELASLKKSDIESVRAFITNPEDQIRLPYGRNVMAYPRRCVFLGTTNSSRPLVDREGNRRFWVVSVKSINVPEITNCVDQLWAEAAARFLDGEAWHLSKEEQDMSDNENSIYVTESQHEYRLGKWLENELARGVTEWDWMSIYDVGSTCLLLESRDMHTAAISDIRKSVETLGWERTYGSRGSRRTYLYRPVAPQVVGA